MSFDTQAVRAKARRAQLFRTRVNLAKKVCREIGIQCPDYPYDEELQPDPLVELCQEELKRTIRGRPALYFQEIKRVPRFSGIMLYPNKEAAELEAALNEAKQIYPEGTSMAAMAMPIGPAPWLHGFVFMVKNDVFVYSGVEPSEFGTAMVIRHLKQRRSIMPLADWLSAVEAIT